MYFGLRLEGMPVVQGMASLHDKRIWCHHVTLKYFQNDFLLEEYKSSQEEMWDFIQENLGKAFQIKVFQLCWNQKVMAFRVNVPESVVMDKNQVHHITIATRKGIPPVESNSMLRNPIGNLSCDFSLTGKLFVGR